MPTPTQFYCNPLGGKVYPTRSNGYVCSAPSSDQFSKFQSIKTIKCNGELMNPRAKVDLGTDQNPKYEVITITPQTFESWKNWSRKSPYKIEEDYSSSRKFRSRSGSVCEEKIFNLIKFKK